MNENKREKKGTIYSENGSDDGIGIGETKRTKKIKRQGWCFAHEKIMTTQLIYIKRF